MVVTVEAHTVVGGQVDKCYAACQHQLKTRTPLTSITTWVVNKDTTVYSRIL